MGIMRQNSRGKIPMTKHSTKTENSVSNVVIDVTKTGDIRTNDFDLDKGKIPALSTIRTQIRSAKTIIETGHTVPIRTEFDRLKIGINIICYGKRIDFLNTGMEEVDEPTKPPTYLEDRDRRLALERVCHDWLYSTPLPDDDEDDNKGLDLSVLDEIEEMTLADIDPDVLTDKKAKRRIPFGIYKDTVGLNNMYINNGTFVIDITGKFMYGPGILGSLHKDNIRDALQKILDLDIVTFNIDEFLKYAQVFVCDVCVDLELDSKLQVNRYIDGISSFFPLSSNSFNISKFGRHGLQLFPKAENLGFSLIAYSKGQELDNSVKRSTKATVYTCQIGNDGQELAKRTLRLETKFYTLDDMRDWLEIPKQIKRVVKLTDVLNSTAPVMLKLFELFSGNAQVLLDRLEWLNDVATTELDGLNLKEIALAEWFITILKDNCFNLELAKAHIKTEYYNAGDKELEKFSRLANLRRHVLNYLVYRKSKSVTIMLSVLGLLQAYYSTGMEVIHE